jgi:hypothetical protein
MQSHAGAAQETSLLRLDIDTSLSFRHPITVEALAYWKSILAGRAMPSRADFDLRAMRDLLPHLGLMEPRRKADGTSDYYIRLIGTRLEQIYGTVTGKTISEFLSPDIQERWRTALDTAVAGRAPIRTIGRMAFQKKLWLEVECLIAPLSHDGETVSMLLVVVATREAGQPPG